MPTRRSRRRGGPAHEEGRRRTAIPAERPRSGRRARAGPREVALEPLARELRHLVERSWLLEQMRGAGNDDELLLAMQQVERAPVQLDDDVVLAADDE